jgi:hypothetical protein
MMLPANLPNVSGAKIPAVYQAAKVAIAECARIDECKDWANKAQALASYAKQADDDSMRKMADRIQARAIRRCGELLRAIERPPQGGRPSKNGTAAGIVSRAQAAKDAGMSKRQKDTAQRVASIPEREFNEAVESEDPPTVTALADKGKKTNIDHLRGLDPEDFKKSTEGQGQLERLAEFIRFNGPAALLRGAYPEEIVAIDENAFDCINWLTQLRRMIQQQGDQTG